MGKYLISALSLVTLLSGTLLKGSDQNVRFGLTGSLNISRHWSPEEFSSQEFSVQSANKTTLALGGLVDVRLNQRFSLQSGITYIKKGSKQNVSIAEIPIGPIKATYSLDYLEIPILLKAYLNREHELLGPHVSAGPYVSFLLSNRYAFKNSFLGEEESSIPGLRRTDFGLMFGIGLDVNGPDALFVFDYRFSLGLTDLSLPTGPGFPEIELRNQCHMFVLEIFL